MKVTVTVRAIQIHGDADKANVTQIDEIMRQVSEQLDRGLVAVKLSGRWIIGEVEHPSRVRYLGPIWGHLDGQRTTKFTRALAEATHLAVASMVRIEGGSLK